MKHKGRRMSNSIWKTPDQKPEETGDIIYTFENGEIGYFFHVKGRKFPTSWLPRQLDYGLEEAVNMTKWCWLSDLLAQANKAERLQKAVDFAVRQFTGLMNSFDEEDEVAIEIAATLFTIKQLIKESQ